MKRDVALVLSSGGPRGLAYIGAIEELLERGYGIHSVAGSSMGSLIGGVYAAGKLEEFKQWFSALNGWSVFSLMDLSMSKNHFIKGDKVIAAIQEIVPNINIENLPIPYTAVATDLCTGEEVIFNRGKLFEAIRASISIPSLFRPVPYGMSMLIDGCMTNALPLNRVARKQGDILVAFDTNYMDIAAIRTEMVREQAEIATEQAFYEQSREEMADIIADFKSSNDQSLLSRLRNAGGRAMEFISDFKDFRSVTQNRIDNDFGDTYTSIINRSFSIMTHHQTEAMLAQHKPDILARMEFDKYGDIADYAKASEIIEIGRRLMRQALDRYEAEQ